MRIKPILFALALALLPCFPVKAEFFPAATTKNGWIEVELDSVQEPKYGIRKFISREIRNTQIKSIDLELIDCFNFRGMFLAQYNIPADMWVQNPNPRFYKINPKSANMMLAMFVCSRPGN